MKKLLLSTLFVCGFASAANEDLVTYHDLQRQIIESSKRLGTLDVDSQEYKNLKKDISKLSGELSNHCYDWRYGAPELITHIEFLESQITNLSRIIGEMEASNRNLVGTPPYDKIIDYIRDYYYQLYQETDFSKHSAGRIDQAEQYFKDLKEGKF